MNSPEFAMSKILSALDRFGTHWQRCRDSGNALNAPEVSLIFYGLEPMPPVGLPITSDPEILTKHQRAMGSFKGIVGLVGGHPEEAGPCPADDAFAQHLEILEEGWVDGWLPDGAQTREVWSELKAVSPQATLEREREAMEATIHGLAVGMDVTLTEFLNQPCGFARITGGSLEAGRFELDDGSVAVLIRHGDRHASWSVHRDGEPVMQQIRPRQPRDKHHAALRVGLLGDDTVLLDVSEIPFSKDTHIGCSVSLPGRILAAPSGMLSDRIVDDMLPGLSYGDLFAYMVRRHGPATIDGDEYKDLCGSWLITTAMPDMFLDVQPSVSSGMPSLHFRAYVTLEARDRLESLFRGYARATPSTTEEEAAIEAYFIGVAPYTRALRDALGDLQRPVIVRDCSINALGEVGDDSPLHGHEDDEEEEDLFTEGPQEDRYSLGATTGLPPGFLDDKIAVYALVKALRGLDATDWSAAMHQAAEMLKAPAPVADALEATTSPSPR